MTISKSVIRRHEYLQRSFLISIVFHITLIIILYYSQIKKNKPIETSTMSVTFTSTNLKNKDSENTTITQPQKNKLNNIKILEKMHTNSIQYSENITDDFLQKKHKSFDIKKNSIQKINNNDQSKKNTNSYNLNLNHILNTLINRENIINLDNNFPIQHSKNNYSKNYTTQNEASIYKQLLSQAISKKFYNSSNYSGKKCMIHIKLTSDGELHTVTSCTGDPSLCQAAISAIKLAHLPRPPNSEIHKIFKDITLNFTP